MPLFTFYLLHFNSFFLFVCKAALKQSVLYKALQKSLLQENNKITSVLQLYTAIPNINIKQHKQTLFLGNNTFTTNYKHCYLLAPLFSSVFIYLFI